MGHQYDFSLIIGLTNAVLSLCRVFGLNLLDYVVEYDLRAQTQPIVDSGEKSQTSFTEETPMRIMFKEIFTFANHVQEIIIRNHSLKRLISDCEDTRKSVSPKAVIIFPSTPIAYRFFQIV